MITEKITIPCAALGCDVECDVDYTPGIPGRHTLSNGDPGYPDEPAELEITSIWLGETEISDALAERVFDQLGEAAAQRMEELAAERRQADADDRAEARARDRAEGWL